MRKRVMSASTMATAPEDAWLNLDRLAQVELTSEDPAHPIEAALLPGGDAGWRAAAPGRQTIRLRFDQPQPLRRIRLVFLEAETARTHEFVLRWSADGGQAYRDIVRQQWTFSPPETTREVEDYRVDLAGVTVLELELVPSISGGPARAALVELRLA